MQIGVNDEFSTLKSIVLGPTRLFRTSTPINSTMERYYSVAPPSRESIRAEQAAFVSVLEAHGVQIVWSQEVPEVPYQLTPRDIGFVIGDRFFVSQPKLDLRRKEILGLEDLLSSLGPQVVQPPREGSIEGGDVILDDGVVWIGLGQRTDEIGAQYIRGCLGGELASETFRLAPGILHLDVVFTVIDQGLAMAFPEGFAEGQVPKSLASRYEVIEVLAEEQADLGVNVLSLGKHRVVSQRRMQRLNDEMRRHGIEVLEVPFDETVKVGGAFRCAVLPLLRSAK